MRFEPVCEWCRKPDLIYEAWARWNVRKQKYELAEVEDNPTIICNNCVQSVEEVDRNE